MSKHDDVHRDVSRVGRRRTRRSSPSTAMLLVLLAAATAATMAAATIQTPPASAANIAVEGDSPLRLRHRRAPQAATASASPSSLSSSSSASSSSSMAVPTRSSSSSIRVDLPDSFTQCRPATINFTSVIGSQDESLLGDTQRSAKENSWLTVVIRDETDGPKRRHSVVELPGTATSWTWPQVDLPAGSTFSVVVSSFSNSTNTSTATRNSSTSSSSSRTSTGRNASTTQHQRKRNVFARQVSSPSTAAPPTASTRMTTKKTSSRDKDPTQVLAHSFSRSTVVAGPDNDTSCLSDPKNPSGTGKDPAGLGVGDDGSRDGEDDRPRRHRDQGTSSTTKIVAALLGSLVGVFATILAILAWQRTKDSRRAKRLALARGGTGGDDDDYDRHGWNASHSALANGGADMTQNGHSGSATLAARDARDRRSVPVPTWDGGYRNSPSAGWTYMSSLVPGLSPGQPPEFGSSSRREHSSPISGGTLEAAGGGGSSHFPLFRNRRRPSAFASPVVRRREEEEEDLPSYLAAQEEIKGLPRYDPALDGGVGLRRHLQEMRLANAANSGGGGTGAGAGERSADSEAVELLQSSGESQSPTAARHGGGGGVSSVVNTGASMAAAAAAHDEEQSTLLQHQQQQSPTVARPPVLRYLPSGPDRPYSSLEMSPASSTTELPGQPPRAEVSPAATLNSIDRRQRQRGAEPLRITTTTTAAAARQQHGGGTGSLVDDGAADSRSPFDDCHRTSSRGDATSRPAHLSRDSEWSQSSE